VAEALGVVRVQHHPQLVVAHRVLLGGSAPVGPAPVRLPPTVAEGHDENMSRR
jgi:hypothetical protein